MYDIVRKYYNTITYYYPNIGFCCYPSLLKSIMLWSKTPHFAFIYQHLWNACLTCTVRHLELEDYVHVMTMVQTDNYMKKFTVRSILFIFNCRSKTYNQSWSHKSPFKVYTRITLLHHNFHYNTTLQLFNCPLLFVCYNNNSMQFRDFPPTLITLNYFHIFHFKTQ